MIPLIDRVIFQYLGDVVAAKYVRNTDTAQVYPNFQEDTHLYAAPDTEQPYEMVRKMDLILSCTLSSLYVALNKINGSCWHTVGDHSSYNGIYSHCRNTYMGSYYGHLVIHRIKEKSIRKLTTYIFIHTSSYNR
jgi:hypothetical protein